MPILLVVDNPKRWPLNIEGVEVVNSRSYLVEPAYMARRGTRVFNLCRSYRYQSIGYYVTLLAEARGHKPIPSVSTVRDLQSPGVVRVVFATELEQRVTRARR